MLPSVGADGRARSTEMVASSDAEWSLPFDVSARREEDEPGTSAWSRRYIWRCVAKRTLEPCWSGGRRSRAPVLPSRS
jgi:hypothetical protein